MHIFIIIIYHHQDAQPGGEQSLCVLQSSKPRPRQAPPSGRRQGFWGPVKIECEMQYFNEYLFNRGQLHELSN